MEKHSVLNEINRRLVQCRLGFHCVVGIAAVSALFSAMLFLRPLERIHRIPTITSVTSSHTGGSAIDGKQMLSTDSANEPASAAAGKVIAVDEKSLQQLSVTLAFDGNDIELLYHLGQGRGWSKGECVRPGYISYWTGWTYSELASLGEGDYSLICKLDDLSQKQRSTLRTAP